MAPDSAPIPRRSEPDEALRILRAASEMRVFMAESGRWKISGDRPPKRAERERLFRAGLVDWKFPERRGSDEPLRLVATEAGRERLKKAGVR